MTNKTTELMSSMAIGAGAMATVVEIGIGVAGLILREPGLAVASGCMTAPTMMFTLANIGIYLRNQNSDK